MSAGDGEAVLSEVSHLFIVPLLLPITKNFRTLLGLKLQAAGLEIGQDQLLLVLGNGDADTVCKVADQLAVRPSTLSKMTDKLAGKGLVQRGKLETDARVTVLRLTEEGVRLQAEVRRIHGEMNQELASTWKADEDEEVIEALTAVTAVLTKRLSRLR